MLAIGVVIAVSVLTGSGPYRDLGNSDPGAVIRIGAPVLRAIADISATICTGSLAYAACFTRRQPSGLVSAEGFGALRGAGRWATLWCVASLLLVPFSEGNIAGQRLSAVMAPDALLGQLNALEPPKAWLLSAACALVLAVACRMTLRWQPAVALLVLAVLALLPPLATGHSSSDTGHDFATAAIMIHVPAAAVWIGVLVVLLRRAPRAGADRLLLVRRYRRLAWVCWLVLVVSGLVEAAVLVPASALSRSGYGLLLLVKVVVVLAIGVLGAVPRRRALRRITGSAGRSAFLRLAGGELVLLLATVGMSVGLSHLFPPTFLRKVTADQTLLGYNLLGGPTPWRLVADWRIDVLYGPLAVLLAAGYIVGLLRLRRRGERWPIGRAAAWFGGCLVLVIATCSGIGRYAPAMFSMHMTAHMLLGMLVPVLLVMGGPLGLAMRVLPEAGEGGMPGPREWLRLLSSSSLARVLTHPLVALLIFVGSPFLLYFTGLFDAAVRFHWAHMAINGYFLAAGYLFFWPVIGVDGIPRPLPNLARLGMLLAAMPFDIVFGAAVIGTHRIIGNGAAGANMYAALALPWVHSLLADQRLGGEIALLLGESALFVAMAALLLRWSSVDNAAGTSGLGGYRTLTADVRRDASVAGRR
ncbi:MAG: cytochrome c oxidase assembly protein [Sciscionella sp.]